MKQKAINDVPVTKKVLKEELAAFRNELKEKLKNYPTKKELKEEIENALRNYPTTFQVGSMLEKSEMRTDEKARQYRDEILTKMDLIVGELAQIREDRLFEKHEKKEFQDQIDDHEKRIKKLEKQSN